MIKIFIKVIMKEKNIQYPPFQEIHEKNWETLHNYPLCIKIYVYVHKKKIYLPTFEDYWITLAAKIWIQSIKYLIFYHKTNQKWTEFALKK